MASACWRFLGLDAAPPTGWSALAFLVIAYSLAVGGLLASTFHLGHPERALKAFTQWRSSWLSREAWVALLALSAMAPYGAGLVFLDQAWRVPGVAGGILSLATVFATSMIYLQMRTVPRWNHWSPPALFLGFALAGGALMTGRVSVALWALPLLAVVQIFAWIDQERREKATDTDLATATGLGHVGRVRAFESPHTGESYLTREMVFQVGRKHAMVLKVISGAAFCGGSGCPAAPALHAFSCGACGGKSSSGRLDPEMAVLCRGTPRGRTILWTLEHDGYAQGVTIRPLNFFCTCIMCARNRGVKRLPAGKSGGTHQ